MSGSAARALVSGAGSSCATVLPADARRPERSRFVLAAAPLVGIALVFASGYSVVRPTNFSGWDEWLVLDLTSRGIVSLPFENRPFSLLFNLPGSVLASGLSGFWWLHGVYLWAAAAGAWRLAIRLAPGQRAAAFLAGVLAAVWAPLDWMRLDPVLLSNYSGATAALVGGIVLLVEAVMRRRLALGAVGSALAFVAVRALESTAALALCAPALLWLLPGLPPGCRGTRKRATALWLAVTLAAVALASRPLWPGQGPSYQVSGLGFDPHPVRVSSRLAAQLRFLFAPAVQTAPLQLLEGRAALASALFVAGWIWLARRQRARPLEPAQGWRLLAAGAVSVMAADLVLVLSPAMRTPWRMQILTGPGAGLLFCGLLVMLAGSHRWLRRLPALAGCWLVLVGTARTCGLQREWDSRSCWPVQSETLRSLVELAPALRPGTLVLLLDGQRDWPAGFTFRHAVQYVYGPGATGAVLGAEPFLYPFRVEAAGVTTMPYASIRDAWRAPVTLHPHANLIVVRARPGGRVGLQRDWPGELPAPAAGARYEPGRRILASGRPRTDLAALWP